MCWKGWTIKKRCSTQISGGCLYPWTEAKSSHLLLICQRHHRWPWMLMPLQLSSVCQRWCCGGKIVSSFSSLYNVHQCLPKSSREWSWENVVWKCMGSGWSAPRCNSVVYILFLANDNQESLYSRKTSILPSLNYVEVLELGAMPIMRWSEITFLDLSIGQGSLWITEHLVFLSSFKDGSPLWSSKGILSSGCHIDPVFPFCLWPSCVCGFPMN